MASLRDFARAFITVEDRSKEGLDSFKKNIREAGDGVRTLQDYLAALGITATAGGMALLLKQAVDYVAQLKTLREVTNATIEELASMREIAKLSGTDFMGLVVPALQQLNKTMLETQAGGGKARDAIRALGLEVESGGRLKNSGQFLLDIAQALERIDDNSRAGFAEKIIKGGAALLPFLKDLVREGGNFVAITAEQVELADEFQTTLARMGIATTLAQQELALGLLPVMNEIASMFLKSKQEGGGLLETIQQLRREGRIANWARETAQDLALVADAALFLAKSFRQIVESVSVVALDIANVFKLFAAVAPGAAWIPQLRETNKAIGEFRDSYVERANRNMEARWGGSMTPAMDMVRSAFSNRVPLPEDELMRTKPPAWAPRLPDHAASDAAAKREQALMKAMVADAERLVKLQEQMDETLANFNQTQSETLQQIQFETTLIGMNEEQREVAVALRKLELDYQKAQAGLGEQELETLRQIYELQKERLPQAVRENAAAKAREEQLKREAEEWKRMTEDVGRSITERIVDGGVRGLSDLREIFVNTFKSMVLRPIIQPIVTGAASAVGGLLGFPGAASAGGLSSLTGGLGLLQAIGGGIGGSFGAGLTYAGSSGVGIMGGLAELFTGGGSLGFGLGAALPGIGLALGAIGLLSSMFDGGGTPATLTGKDLPAGVASYGGLAGTVFGNDSNQGYRWAGEQWSGVFQPQIRGVYDTVARLGGALGYDTSGIRGYSASISTGQFMDAGEILPSVLAQLSDQLIRQVIPNLAELARAGETATQTLERMATDLRDQALGRATAVYNLGRATSDLWLSDLSPLTATERFNRSNSRYAELLGLARGGDIAAINDLQSFVRSNLGEAASYYGTANPQYRALFEGRQGDIEGLEDSTYSDAATQIALLSSSQNIETLLKSLPAEFGAQFEAYLTAAVERLEATQRETTDQVVGAVTDTATQTALINNGAAGAAFWDADGNWIGPGRDPSNRG